MTDSTANTVSTTISANGIATVTLNRPEKNNAFDDSMIAQLIGHFQAIDNDPNIRAMILAASGKNFSAGGDLAWMKRMASYSYEQNLQDAHGLAQMLKTLNFMSKPTIARIQGAAYGGAVGLACCCDIVVASSDAKFCLSEVKIGLIPATIAPYVIAAIGERASRRYCLSAELIDAQKALQLGIASEVVASNELDNCIANICKQLLSNGPSAMSAAKQLIFELAHQPIDAAIIETSCQAIAQRRAGPEGQEGLSAFLEKRKPQWYKDQ
ncbi:enoyl-CoA hydratase/isomerase family protein [Dasania sp. GY-MA-18]|uniref:Enoyl-CoA hydratase/isomerase family protein n=1 Tax=Dasania phycosphaerae TaxID=2950436 RepID=A0A9J6RIG5_9GAMM|nr:MULTISPECIES: enoyl-CoA hydratase/isomerase family protein [Dasania]MCR8921353.1 enoyl-CoA hydratase/isomerase family protein [Dasania sp. GY-MA-18]MCZ0863781.1 enoyl-CoA hydratase/isomerase family protein [Dasania phycosphaerae]MCZ0867509.1 enoyl-CoA hydratase/isomerase family protein [Dasania phycosphaerae]